MSGKPPFCRYTFIYEKEKINLYHNLFNFVQCDFIPFTVEAVPAPVVSTLDDLEKGEQVADSSVARSGETQRQSDWRDELLKTGIRGKGGQRIEFSRVEPLPGTRWLHADAETKEDSPERVVISFGQEHAPLEQRQVGLALDEAETLRPKPKIIVFAAF